jgi:guanine deaminase
MATAYFGPVINPQSLTDYLALPQCLILVSAEGDIDQIYEDLQPPQVQEIVTNHPGINFIQLQEGQFLMPGLIDTHAVRQCVF